MIPIPLSFSSETRKRDTKPHLLECSFAAIGMLSPHYCSRFYGQATEQPSKVIVRLSLPLERGKTGRQTAEKRDVCGQDTYVHGLRHGDGYPVPPSPRYRLSYCPMTSTPPA
jgi:hypothetical protein